MTQQHGKAQRSQHHHEIVRRELHMHIAGLQELLCFLLASQSQLLGLGQLPIFQLAWLVFLNYDVAFAVAGFFGCCWLCCYSYISR